MTEPLEPSPEDIERLTDEAELTTFGAEAIEQSEIVTNRIGQFAELLSSIEKPEDTDPEVYQRMVTEAPSRIPGRVGEALLHKIPREPRSSALVGYTLLNSEKSGDAALLDKVFDTFDVHTNVGDEPDKVLKTDDIAQLTFLRHENEVQLFGYDVFGVSEAADSMEEGQAVFILRNSDDPNEELHGVILPTKLEGIFVQLSGEALSPVVGSSKNLAVDFVINIKEIRHLGEEQPVPDTIPEDWQ